MAWRDTHEDRPHTRATLKQHAQFGCVRFVLLRLTSGHADASRSLGAVITAAPLWMCPRSRARLARSIGLEHSFGDIVPPQLCVRRAQIHPSIASLDSRSGQVRTSSSPSQRISRLAWWVQMEHRFPSRRRIRPAGLLATRTPSFTATVQSPRECDGSCLRRRKRAAQVAWVSRLPMTLACSCSGYLQGSSDR